MDIDLSPVLWELSLGNKLGAKETERVFRALLSGNVPDVQVAAVIMALRVRCETVEELEGSAIVLRDMMLPVTLPVPALDIVGTGGYHKTTLNVSTCASIVAAGAGVSIAKHGSVAFSSKSGSADVLQKLGVNIMLKPEIVAKCVEEIGLGFMFALNHHPGLKSISHIRKKLGIRSIFNLLGPCCNPANVAHYVMGVSDKRWLKPVAEMLERKDIKRAIAVYGANGIDEISNMGSNLIAEVGIDGVRYYELTAEELGYKTVVPSDLKGGDSDRNAEMIKGVVKGQKSPFYDLVMINAGAAIYTFGLAESLKDGCLLAEEAVISGSAKAKLDALIEFTQRYNCG